MHVVHSAKDAARLPKKPTAFDFLIISYNFVQKMVRWREGGGEGEGLQPPAGGPD